MKIKIITGYNGEHVLVPAEEAHRAYHLFLNPTERGIFSNKVTLRGQDIMRIEADFHSAMGWNEGYKMLPEDYAVVRALGIERKTQEILKLAQEAAKSQELLMLPLNIPQNLLLIEAPKKQEVVEENKPLSMKEMFIKYRPECVKEKYKAMENDNL